MSSLNMDFIFSSNVVKVGNSFMITIPKPLCNTFKIKRGSKVELIASEHGITIPLEAKEVRGTSKVNIRVGK